MKSRYQLLDLAGQIMFPHAGGFVIVLFHHQPLWLDGGAVPMERGIGADSGGVWRTIWIGPNDSSEDIEREKDAAERELDRFLTRPEVEAAK